MRRNSLVLASASVLVLALASAPAAAQAVDPATPPDPNVEAQESPADPEAGAAQTDDAVQTSAGADQSEVGSEAIVVTGLRRSLRSAQNIKRNSEQIVDAIVAEDIGKLPDLAVSDTAARIPGVQVERGGGEAGRVLVRGLPDFTTTYNGREIFTAETRTVALQDFPSGAIGAIEVFKTSTANLVEPGLAGLVNVRSRRPFDFDGFEIAGSVWGLYTHQAKEVTPNGNILITNRWDVGDGGEVGALLGFSYTRLKYLDSTRSNTDFVAGGPDGTRFPDVQRVTYGSGDRARPSINGAIQYRPSPGVELYVEGLWQGFRNKVSDRELTVPLWGGTFTDYTTRDGRPDLLESGTVVDPFRPDGFQGGTYNRTNTYQLAVGGSYDAGPLRVTADLARTMSTFTGDTSSVDYALANRHTIEFDTDTNGDNGGAEFEIIDFDPSDPAEYVYRGYYEQAQQSKGDDWQARVDFEYDTGIDMLPKLQFGTRYTTRDAHREFGDRYHAAEGLRLPFSAVPLDYELFDAGFRGSDVQQLRSWISPTYSSIRNNIRALRQFSLDNGADPNVWSLDDAQPDPLQTWDATEKTLAAYAQVNYDVEFYGLPVDGNFGLRAVKTNIDLTGVRRVNDVLTDIDLSDDYIDWLPNISARARLSDQLQLRLSASQTRTRPTFRDLRPSGVTDPRPACLDEPNPPPSCVITANGGNPDLDRLKSINYDASLEYFFSRTGFAAVALFRRNLEGFIEETQEQRFTPEGDPLRFTGPINSGSGRIQGFEAQVSTFFDFAGTPAWLSNFGAQANVTHLDAKANFNYAAETVSRRLLGVSKWSYNLVGMYEGGPLSARLSYNWRSGFPQVYAPRDGFYNFEGLDQGHLYTEEAKPVGRLDLSSSYTIMDNLTLFADWTNILGKPFRSTLTRIDPDGTESSFPRLVRYEETTVSVGTRFRF